MPQRFFESEAATWLRRWREPLVAACLAALGAYWIATASGLLPWMGGALAIAGTAAAYAGWRRARFRSSGGGAGVVQLDEGRLTYFGPFDGGTVAVREIDLVALDRDSTPSCWILGDPASQLRIPVDAEGADALLDVLTQLPGLDVTAAFAATKGEGGTVTLWCAERLPASRRIGTGTDSPS